MAKKRKRGKARIKRVRVRTVTRKIREAQMTPTKAAYILGVASGLIVLIAGILAVLGIKIMGWSIVATTVGMAVGLISGLVILIATAMIRKNPRVSGIVMLIFSLIALAVQPNGFIFGPVLGLIGSAILLLRR